MRKLAPEDVAAYERDGFAAPFDALTPAEADACRAELEAFEATLGGPLTQAEGAFRYKSHLLHPWVAALVRHPAILDAVEDLIGPDILCWTSTWFIKEPHSPAVARWHQDATYFGLRPHRHVTAWLAISDASEAAGCMEFVRGSHRLGQLPHHARADPNSMNGGGQRTVEDFDGADLAAAPLRRGQFSLHHTLVVHRSEPNRSADRRIGIGISYIPASVRHIGSARMFATLVRGSDHGHFELEPAPARAGDPAAAELHAAAYRRYRAGYNEQVAWHGQGRGLAPEAGA